MTTCPVAQFLQQRIAASGLPYETLAKEVGLKTAADLKVLVAGERPVPWACIAPLAKTLKAPPGELITLCVRTYYPDIWDAIAPLQDSALSRDELAMVRALRESVSAPFIAALSDESSDLLEQFLRSVRTPSNTIH